MPLWGIHSMKVTTRPTFSGKRVFASLRESLLQLFHSLRSLPVQELNLSPRHTRRKKKESWRFFPPKKCAGGTEAFSRSEARQGYHPTSCGPPAEMRSSLQAALRDLSKLSNNSSLRLRDLSAPRTMTQRAPPPRQSRP